MRTICLLGFAYSFLAVATDSARSDDPPLQVGFAEIDITPDVNGPNPVWIAGYGHGRRATGVHDPIMVRCAVLAHGADRVALVCADLIGLQYPEVELIRSRLSGYRYVLVASTHNHEGPDVIGIWGATPFKRGVDTDYVRLVVDRCAQVVRDAEQKLAPATASFGTASDESLLRDSREPYVKDGVIRVLKFARPGDGKLLGMITQFSCHPESLGSRNTLLTADFPAATIAQLKNVHGCPVVYFSGAVGGLMTNPPEPIQDEKGESHPDGTFAYAEVYGKRVAEVVTKAVHGSQSVEMTPFTVSAGSVALPIDNQVYRAARELGVLHRPGIAWTGDFESIRPLKATPGSNSTERIAVQTEVACLQLGQVSLACIPGELYPELVYARVPDPPDPGADFPDSPPEPSINQIFSDDRWLLIGLANDEIGYIIPKRQWDEKRPFCYGRSKSQYGEINSCGPDIAPIVMEALARRAREASSVASPDR